MKSMNQSKLMRIKNPLSSRSTHELLSKISWCDYGNLNEYHIHNWCNSSDLSLNHIGNKLFIGDILQNTVILKDTSRINSIHSSQFKDGLRSIGNTDSSKIARSSKHNSVEECLKTLSFSHLMFILISNVNVIQELEYMVTISDTHEGQEHCTGKCEQWI